MRSNGRFAGRSSITGHSYRVIEPAEQQNRKQADGQPFHDPLPAAHLHGVIVSDPVFETVEHESLQLEPDSSTGIADIVIPIAGSILVLKFQVRKQKLFALR